MKTTLLSICAMAISYAISQPVITEASYMPIGTQVSVGAHSGAIQPGGSGPNQIWNFSGLSYNSVGNIIAVSPANAPCGNLFPSTSFALSIPNGTIHFYNRTSEKIEWVGKNWPVATCTGGVTYSDFMQNNKFPFSYLDSFSDTYNADDGTSGTTTMTYDGYGTLITPFGTYNEVARFVITTGNVTDYAWMKGNGMQYELMRTIDGNSSTLIFSEVNPSKIKVIENDNQGIIIPNPANQKITFMLNTDAKLSNAIVRIYDYSGKLISEKVIVNLSSSVEINELNEGIYFCELINNNSSFIKGKFVVIH
jgi:hypothetical protein